MNKKKIEEWATSTGIKLIHHPDLIRKLQHGMASPVSLQIAPTSRCQLKCIFCSNVNRSVHEDLDPKLLMNTVQSLMPIGLKTVEWTGGGDPTKYEYITECISHFYYLGLDQGIITNGLGFNKINVFLPMFKWVRISMNCLDYVKDIDIPYIPNHVTLGFSYVINDLTTPETFGRLDTYVKKYEPKYVRIVPNCQVSHEDQELNNEKYSNMVESWGSPYFYQAKVFNKPNECYWGYIKPFLLHDGYVYRCSSIVLNDDADRSFHSKYRWCKMEGLANVYKNVIVPFDSSSCDKCVFFNQNNLIGSILNPNGMENFI